jgi:hypothetical protein
MSEREHRPKHGRTDEPPAGVGTSRHRDPGHPGTAAAPLVTRLAYIEADPLVMERDTSSDDGAESMLDSEARAAKAMLRRISHQNETAIHNGLQAALLRKVVGKAMDLDPEKQREVTEFVAKSLWEKALDVAGEVGREGLRTAAEGAEAVATPLLCTYEIGSLAEGVAKANLEIREATAIKALVERIQAGIPARFESDRRAIDGMDGQAAVDAAETAEATISAGDVAEEFEVLVETAMIESGYSASEAIDKARERVEAVKRLTGAE